MTQIRLLHTSSYSFDSNNRFKFNDAASEQYNLMNPQYKVLEPSSLVPYKTTVAPFRNNPALIPHVLDLIDYLGEILPSRSDYEPNVLLWYKTILNRLDTMKDGFIHSTDSESVTDMIRVATTDSDTEVSFIYLLWVKLGFRENHLGLVKSPYANEVTGYDYNQNGFFLRWAEARILVNWLHDFISLYLLQQLKADLDRFPKTSDAHVDLLPIRADLLRAMSPNVRAALKPVGVSVQQRIYAGFDTEYRVIEMGVVDPLSYQLAISTRILVKTHNVDALDVNKSMQAIGNDYKVLYQEAFGEASNVNILVNALCHLTSLLKDNSHMNTLAKLEDLAAKGNLHKSITSKGYTYTELSPVTNNIPDCAKYIEYINKDTKLTSEALMGKIWKLGEPLLNNDLANLNTLMGGVSLPPVKGKNCNVYLLGHYLVADLAVLSDFSNFKTEMDLLYKSFSTLAKPYNVKLGTNHHMHVYFRDTGMVSPAGSSLAAIGNLYDFNKIDLPKGAIERMDLLQKSNKELFDAYAIRDAEIALIHGLSVEYFNAKHVDTRVEIPTTVASMSKAFVLNYWDKNSLPDINRHTEYHVGDFRELFTPKGIQTTGNLASITPMFTGAYRGGRNESFAYGYDSKSLWYDYDLTGAYPTGMALLGQPDYDRAFVIPTSSTIKDMDKLEAFTNTLTNEFVHSDKLYNSYSTFTVKFKFPLDTKYPNLPVHLNKTLTIYPLEGVSQTTGFELKVALMNGCKVLEFISGAIVPFKNTPWVSYKAGQMSIKDIYGAKDGAVYKLNDKESWGTAPYFGVVNYLQEERRKYPKKSFNNLFYKLMANSGYGQICIGLSSKSLFNSRANRMDKSAPGALTNPLLACQTTGLIRAVLSEAINHVDSKHGSIVSCTTDGFITNLPELEKDPDFGRGPLTAYYRYGRKILSGNDALLELKTSSLGVASWCVRGQLGLGPDAEGNATSLKAMTGFQSKFYNLSDLQKLVKGALAGLTDKNIHFMQWSLRSGKDIYLDGGYVTPKLEEKTFRLNFDNRRRISPSDLASYVTPVDYGLVPVNEHVTDLAVYVKPSGLLDTTPWLNDEICKLNLVLAKMGKHKYAQHTGYPILGSKYKNYKEIAVRQFLRAMLQGHIPNPFNKYSDIKAFLKSEANFSISLTAIANYKRPERPFLPGTVPRVPSTEEFFARMKKYIDFDENKFFK